LERFDNHTLLAVRLETGRTHQIRVHMTHVRHPLVGDRIYGSHPRPPRGASEQLIDALQRFPRQALHALVLGLDHPLTGEPMRWEAPIPEDLSELLRLLRGAG
jgi:23S rRNA pseudouridine1911/1915/1917 synthase